MWVDFVLLTPQPTITFDILLLWWAITVIQHLEHARYFTENTIFKWSFLLAIVLIYVVSGLALLLRPDPAVVHFVLVCVLPCLFQIVMLLLTWITRMSRGSALWAEAYSVIGNNPLEILVVCVGLPCALRLQLLFMGRNELAENWFALYGALFAAFCSMVVRLLRHSAIELATPDGKVCVCVYVIFALSVYVSLTPADVQDPDNTAHKVAVEDARRSVFLAAKWTWALCMGVVLTLLLMYSAPVHTLLTTPVLAARAAVLCFVIMFALQFPLRSYKNLPIIASQQPLVFHVCEFAARAFPMIIMWYYLLS